LKRLPYVLPLIGLLVALYRVDKLKGLLRLGLGIAFWVLIFTLPLWIGYPEWIDGMREAFTRNNIWYHPSLFTMATITFGTLGLILWGIIALAMTGLNVYLWLRLPPLQAMIWSLALNLLVTPYVWTWDFVLLLPLLVYVFFQVLSNAARFLIFAGYIAVWVLMWHIQQTTNNSDALYWWFPWLTVAYIVAASWLDKWFKVQPDAP
jgi:hypothetical protein